MGDPLLGFWNIPPAYEAIEYEANCPSECTQQWNQEIYVIGDSLHMHAAGTQMWSTHWRDGQMIDVCISLSFADSEDF